MQLAPFIKILADRIADTAAEARGFRDEVTSGMSTIADAMGVGLFALERLHIGWVGLKVGASLAIFGIINTLAELDRAYTDAMNSLASSWIGRLIWPANSVPSTMATTATTATSANDHRLISSAL